MTSLSSSYQETSTFAKEFNGAVLVLKRRQLGPAIPPPTDDEESHARLRLTSYLQSILAQLSPNEGQPAADWIPDAIIDRLTEKNQSKMPWLIQDLRKAQRTLEEGTSPGEQDFSALDEVCDAADATASASFRRLWRR